MRDVPVKFLVFLVVGIGIAISFGGEASTQPTRRDSHVLGISFEPNERWRIEEVAAGGPADGERISALRIHGLDEKSTITWAVLRMEQPLKGADPAKRVDSVIAHHRESTLANGGTVERDSPIDVAGTRGRLLQLAFKAEENPLSTLIVSFVLNDREYKVGLIGAKDRVPELQPTVMRFIQSIQVTADNRGNKQ